MNIKTRISVLPELRELFVPKDIIYYLGAGASYNGLPLVKDFEEKMIQQINWVKSLIDNNFNRDSDLSFKVYQKHMQEIIENSINFASIDTYAKKLYITNKNKYEHLKLIVSVFLTIEQVKNGPDSRYDSFFASIIGNKAESLPPNFGIISWNYDCHLELAYMKYAENYDLQEIQAMLHVNGKNNFNNRLLGWFSILKINGSASIVNLKTKDEELFVKMIKKWPEDHTVNKYSFIKEVFENYGTLSAFIDTNQKDEIITKDNKCNLSFCWEEEQGVGNVDVIETGIEMIKSAKSIVVIGYSFPFFNRDIDNELFRAINQSATIYVQDPNAINIVESLQERFPILADNFRAIQMDMNKDQNVPISRKVDGFFIPTNVDFMGKMIPYNR